MAYNVKIDLRPEEEKDHRLVENITREAFWNVHVPGCSEHALIRNLRKAKEFVGELDFVAVCDGEVAGNIVYARAKIKKADTEYTVLTFGPLSVLPEYQNRGIGGALINHTTELAKKMDYPAVIIYGDPEYYKRFGFKASKEYRVTNKENKYPAALLVLELFPGALRGIQGVFDEGAVYEISEKETEEFEKEFAPKEKGFSKTQERFTQLIGAYL